MKRLLGIGILSLILACESGPKGPDEAEKKVVIAEVEKMFEDYHAAIKAEGLTGEFKFLDNTEEFFWVPPGYASPLSYDSVRYILENAAGAFEQIEFEWESLEIYPLSKRIASYTGIVSGSMLDTAGQKARVHIIESGTLIKRDEGWKLLCGQSASLD